MSVTLAMLVKEPPLDRLTALLELVRRTVSQTIIVVDDRTSAPTYEAMEDLGARLIPFRWCDDFSAGRNEALAHVTGDWILHLDPDEVPSRRMLAFIEMVDASPWQPVVDWQGQQHYDPRGYLFWTTDASGSSDIAIEHDWHCRLFRAGRGRWYKPVHEQVSLDGLPEHLTRETPLLVKAPRSAYLLHDSEGSAEKDAFYRRLDEGVPA